MTGIHLRAVATPENFDEAGHLAANPDVAEAVRSGQCPTGRQRFDLFGRNERRQIKLASPHADIQREKIGRIEPLLELACGTMLFAHKPASAAQGVPS